MKKNKNKKGMTLVEVIVAMTLLGIASSMFVVAATYANRANVDNYERSTEMYNQEVNAEQYNDAITYDIDKIKVNKYIGTGAATNNFTLKADFGGSIVWNTTAYGFKSKLNNIDEDAGYQLKFLKGKDASVTPNVSDGVYWVKFYNDSGADLVNYVETPTLTGGKFFDANNNSSGNKVFMKTLIGSVSQFGAIIGSSDFFGFTENAGLYEDATHVSSSSDFKITVDNFDHFCEYKDTSKTGFIIIHYMGGNTYLNQAEFEAL